MASPARSASSLRKIRRTIALCVLLSKASISPPPPPRRCWSKLWLSRYWLGKRAVTLQNGCFDGDNPICEVPEHLALYLRYQTTHDRAFHKALNTLLRLRAEKRKQEIGFESQARVQAEEVRRQARENRRRDLHRPAVLLAEAKVAHHQLLASNQPSPKLAVSVGR
jgi:hypothetical protein